MGPDLFLSLRALTARSPSSREKLLAARDRALQRLIRHAYRNVPYYRHLFDRNGLDPRSIRRAEDLRAVPITNKEDLRRAGPGDTVARGLDPQSLPKVRTGGATAEPFTIRRTPREGYLTFGYWLRAYRHWGGRTGCRHVSVRYTGHRERGRRTVHEALMRFLGLSRRHIIPADTPVAQILEEMSVIRPRTFDAIPSVLLRMAERASQRHRRSIRPQFIGTGSETLTPGMKRVVEAVFRAPLYQTYGSHELNLIAWDCPVTGEMHTCDDALIVEVLKGDRRAEPGEPGELVATYLLGYAMPFIRYRLADVVTQGLPLCACGAPFGTIRAVEGRTLDYLRLPEGGRLHPYRLAEDLVYEANWIKRYRFTQEREDRILLELSPLREPESGAVRAIAEKLGPKVELCVKIVPEINPPPGEKFRLLRS